MLLLLLPPLLQTHRTAVLMRTTGYFAGQSTAVVEILQSRAPGLVMVMMMVGNAAVAATATVANTQNSGAHTAVYFLIFVLVVCSPFVWVVCRCSGQSGSYSFAQSSTDWFCSLSCPPVASLIFLAVCGAALLVLTCILYFCST